VVVDGHAHVLSEEHGSAQTLLARYAEAGIDRGVLVPGGMLDVRKMTRYITGREKPVTLDIPNHLVEDAMKKYPDRFYGFYCVNPHRGPAVLDELEDAVGRGFSGLKLAPVVHSFSYSAPVVLDLMALCGHLGIPAYMHSLGSPDASTEAIAGLAGRFPGTTVIIGHMGLGPADVDAVSCAREHENVYVETSGGSHLILRQALDELGSTKILFGSEFPLQHPLVEITRIFALKCPDADRENILGRNMLRLLRKL
jgi:predicted TIM-barrel fold metal-dependent hydrolase